MPSEVNPFEPWRPAGSGRNDDEVHPWHAPRHEDRPPPDADDREVPYYQRRAGHAEPEEPIDRPRPPTAANGLLVILFLILALTGLGALGSLGSGHAARVGAICGTIFLGALLGLSVLHGSRWYVRVGVCAAGCALALACYYFFPTANGLTLWTANARIASLGRIAPGDFDAFTAARPGIDEVRREFTLLEMDIARAEGGWAVRTTAQVVQAAAAERQKDPARAIDTLDQHQRSLRHLGFEPAGKAFFRQAVKETMEAVLQRIERESSDLAARGQFLHAQELIAEQSKAVRDRSGWEEVEGDKRVREIRQSVFRAHLHAGAKLLERLVSERKWDDVAREARRLNADLIDAGGRAEDAAIRAALDGPRRNAVLGRLDAAVAAADEKAKAGQHAEAERIAAAALAAVSDESKALRLTGEVEARLLPIRRQALQVRMDAGGRALQALVDKKDHAAVATQGAALHAELSGSARELGLAERLETRVNDPRRQALRARLDRVRVEIDGLFAKERFVEIGKVGPRVEADLAAEADRLKVRDEVDAIVKRCKFIGGLAELAGKK